MEKCSMCYNEATLMCCCQSKPILFCPQHFDIHSSQNFYKQHPSKNLFIRLSDQNLQFFKWVKEKYLQAKNRSINTLIQALNQTLQKAHNQYKTQMAKLDSQTDHILQSLQQILRNSRVYSNTQNTFFRRLIDQWQPTISSIRKSINKGQICKVSRPQSKFKAVVSASSLFKLKTSSVGIQTNFKQQDKNKQVLQKLDSVYKRLKYSVDTTSSQVKLELKQFIGSHKSIVQEQLGDLKLIRESLDTSISQRHASPHKRFSSTLSFEGPSSLQEYYTQIYWSRESYFPLKQTKNLLIIDNMTGNTRTVQIDTQILGQDSGICLFPGHIFYTGGKIRNWFACNRLNNCLLIDPKTGATRQIGRLQQGRDQSFVCSYAGCVFIFGGNAQIKLFSSMKIDLVSGLSASLKPLPAESNGMTGVGVGDLMVLSGRDLKQVLVYSVELDQYTGVLTVPSTQNKVVCRSRDKIFVLCKGKIFEASIQELETWKQVGKFSQSLKNLQSNPVFYDDRVFFVMNSGLWVFNVVSYQLSTYTLKIQTSQMALFDFNSPFASEVVSSPHEKIFKERVQRGYGLNPSKNLEIESLQKELVSVWNWVTKSRAYVNKETGLLELVKKRPAGSSIKEINKRIVYNSQFRIMSLNFISFDTREAANLYNQLDSQGRFLQSAYNAFISFNTERALNSLRLAQMPTLLAILETLGLSDVNRSNRLLLERLASQSTEKYEQAILYFLAGNDNYSHIFSLLSFTQRLNFALKFLPDSQLEIFIKQQIQQASRIGNIQGIILTGFTQEAIPILHQFQVVSGDIQTIGIISILMNSKNQILQNWGNKYKVILNKLELWHSRCQLQIEEQENFPSKIQKGKCIKCYFCGKSLALPDLLSSLTANRKMISQYSTKAQIKHCPECMNSLPRCMICLTPYSSINPYFEMQRSLRNPRNPPPSKSFDEWFSWCQKCHHGGHNSHLLEWFKENLECAAAGCLCTCMSLD